jgi:hypothetical protein
MSTSDGIVVKTQSSIRSWGTSEGASKIHTGILKVVIESPNWMDGRPPTKKELNQQERKVMKVEGEKLVFDLAAQL